MPDPILQELRCYRDLHRRRDPLIYRAAREGYSGQTIARASGLSYERVLQILRNQRRGQSR
jgi:hypothetical protein